MLLYFCLSGSLASSGALHLEVTLTLIPQLGLLNAIGRYVLGLFHTQTHLEQLHEIVRQAAS
jgi:hypothetical protein